MFITATICGSMRFYDLMLITAQELTKEGVIVLMPFVTFSREEQRTSQVKRMLDRMHFAKIDMSALIVVVNPGGYIGASTRREIDYAIQTGKQVRYLLEPPE